jgi:acyl dehydratase
MTTGEQYSHKFKFTQEDVANFAKMTGDTNPLHLDAAYAETTIFKKPIMHGFLGGSIFSKVLGTLFPGKGTVYLKQSMEFLRPMFVEEEYEATFVIREVFAKDGKASIETLVKDSRGKTTIKGDALVLNPLKFKE